jgi:hypothetical protein
MAGSAWRHGGLLLAMAVVLGVLFVVWRRRNLRGAGVA